MADRRTSMLSLLAVGLAGCSTHRAASPTPRGPWLWPAPPEQPRYIYEGTLRNAASLRDDAAPAPLQRLLTGEDNTRAGFGKPLAVAATRGRVYVTDTEERRVFVFDLPRRRTFSFGLRLEGELKKPVGIDVDGLGLVYVVDATARRVVVFDGLGLYVRQIDGAGRWARPTGIAVSATGDRVCVVDTGGVESDSHRIWIYGADGGAIGSLGGRGNQPGQFNLPTDAAVGPDGSLWVLDAGNFRVQAFDAAGQFQRMFGSVGNAVGQFARPRGLAIDRDGLVYVSDATFCNVQVFQPDGQLLLAIGGRADSDSPGRYRLPAKLACDEGGRLYIVDQFLHKIEVLRRLNEAEGRRLQAAPRA
jgi:DNA-binding beta-propeller fold protein YncE